LWLEEAGTDETEGRRSRLQDGHKRGRKIAKITVTKLEAARGQLRTAIKLWFEGGDPVAIHSLASAAHEIIHALYRQKGLKGLVFDTPYIRPDMQQRWASSLKKPFNFFKHGRHEPGDATIELETQWTVTMMMACAKGLTNMGEPPEMEILALTYWTFFNHSGAFAANQHLLQNPKVQYLQQLATKGPEVFFREFAAGWESGHLVFGATWPKP
jgi:hypothetical protein